MAISGDQKMVRVPCLVQRFTDAERIRCRLPEDEERRRTVCVHVRGRFLVGALDRCSNSEAKPVGGTVCSTSTWDEAERAAVLFWHVDDGEISYAITYIGASVQSNDLVHLI
jgi:hypothetical protein